jgi:hypothetical protein
MVANEAPPRRCARARGLVFDGAATRSNPNDLVVMEAEPLIDYLESLFGRVSCKPDRLKRNIRALEIESHLAFQITADHGTLIATT